MGLEYALDELYRSGWAPLDETACERHSDGRIYPGLDRVRREFGDAGYELSVRHVELFDCYRAEWRDDDGAAGAVVGQSDLEAAIYALSQVRRQLAETH